MFVSFLCPLLLYFGYINTYKLSGTIEEDIKFYHRKLSENPSILATIEYSVIFKHAFGGKKLRIFTSENHTAFKDECLSSNYGQLRNENLHTPLGANYRFTKCEGDKYDPIFNHCYGKIRIQDYIARHYSFSFGFYCGENGNISLQGLSYNFSIYDQSNNTNCFSMPDYEIGSVQCRRYYSHMTLPNLMGHIDWARLAVWMRTYGTLLTSYSALMSNKLCYKYIQEFLCYMFMPKCHPRKKTITHLCRETCQEVISACEAEYLSVFRTIHSAKQQFLFDSSFIAQLLNHMPVKSAPPFNCDYLPSVNGTIPCFHKPVTCSPPPEWEPNGAVVIGNISQSYLTLSEVEYSCPNDSFIMKRE